MRGDQASSADSPLHRPADGPPPRAGEEICCAKHYPNDLLISGFDILFFWDARMMMLGMHQHGQIPWPRLYLHGLVRAPDGQKMSKSKGNVVDPLGLIDQYGADALRFFMAAMESQGRDIKMDEKRVEGYRNFATKLWNATRFCQSNGIGASQTRRRARSHARGQQVDRRRSGRDAGRTRQGDGRPALRCRRERDLPLRLGPFCDWYLELIKGQFRRRDQRAVAGWVLDQILVMLHPFMPFITEELWHAQGERPYDLIVAKWPEPQARCRCGGEGRSRLADRAHAQPAHGEERTRYRPGRQAGSLARLALQLATRVILSNAATLDRLARLSAIHQREAPAGAAMQIGAGSDMFVIPLEGVIDIEAEKARLAKALEAARKEAKALEGRLANANFVERPSPRRSRRRAPTTRTTRPRPSGSKPRWRGWGSEPLSCFVTLNVSVPCTASLPRSISPTAPPQRTRNGC